MEINRPDIVQEVTDAFQRYEQALNANDVDVLNELFWNDPLTLRFGVAEMLYGHDALPLFEGHGRRMAWHGHCVIRSSRPTAPTSRRPTRNIPGPVRR